MEKMTRGILAIIYMTLSFSANAEEYGHLSCAIKNESELELLNLSYSIKTDAAGNIDIRSSSVSPSDYYFELDKGNNVLLMGDGLILQLEKMSGYGIFDGAPAEFKCLEGDLRFIETAIRKSYVEDQLNETISLEQYEQALNESKELKSYKKKYEEKSAEFDKLEAYTQILIEEYYPIDDIVPFVDLYTEEITKKLNDCWVTPTANENDELRFFFRLPESAVIPKFVDGKYAGSAISFDEITYYGDNIDNQSKKNIMLSAQNAFRDCINKIHFPGRFYKGLLDFMEAKASKDGFTKVN